MFCTKCGTKIGAGARFCGGCSWPIAGTVAHASASQERQGNHRQSWVPAAKTSNGAAAITAVRKRKSSVLWSVVGVNAVVVVGLLGGSMIASRGSALAEWGVIAAGICVIVTLLAATNINKWSQKVYYSIPGSRDSAGEHRCLWCGSRGIHKRGVYKTDLVIADCSKCGAELWQE